ncbi:type II toxin-antitoxin system VapC family toxin [Nocardiopsis gilva]
MLIVDTGPLVAYLHRKDPEHVRRVDLLESHEGQLMVTPYVLTEACYLVAKYIGAQAEINLVEAVAAGDLTQVIPDQDDLARIAELMHCYQGFPLGLADASVISLAERCNAAAVATLDHRHFHAVKPRHVPSLKLLP